MAEPKRIRVLECIRQGKIGGGESHLLSLMENIDRTVFDPVVLSFTDGPMISSLEKIGVKTEVIHTERPFDVTKWKLIKKWMKKQNVDLVHAHGTRAGSNVLWAARSLKIPLIYTIHGWSFHNDQKPIVKKVRMLGEKYLTGRSTLNISVSQSNKESGEKSFGKFRSIVINNGIDANKFDPEKNYKDIRKELSIPENAVLVLFLARFTKQKQPIALLKAFIEAEKFNPNMFLLMVGDGEQKEEAETILENSGLKDKIRLLPFRQDVPDILKAADIFVLGSLWEGLPIALLEAMAMAKTIIASRVDGTIEIIDHLQNGYLVDPANLEENIKQALVQLSADEGLRKKLQVNARNTVKDRFNAGNMTREIEKVYQQVLCN